VLAIVAYREPIARSGIEFIRSSASESAVDTLLQRGLIDHNPHHILVTTRAFLELAGLRDLADCRLSVQFEGLRNVVGEVRLSTTTGSATNQTRFSGPHRRFPARGAQGRPGQRYDGGRSGGTLQPAWPGGGADRQRPRPQTTYTASAGAQIVATAQREPDRRTDGTATWSLSTLQRTLRRSGLPRMGTGTIRRVLQDAAVRTSTRAPGVQPGPHSASARPAW